MRTLSHEILIVGAGTMGASLAQAYAQNGFNVALLDITDEIVQRGLNTINDELQSARGKIFQPDEISAIRQRITGTTSYEEACASAQLKLVIEAATENIEIKKKIYADLDRLTGEHVVLATNSSSLNANILASATKRPDKVVWMHYFYLPHKNRAAEYAGTDTASSESMHIAREYLVLGGKIPTLVRGSRKGGVADIIFVSLLLEATRMLEDGYRMSTIEEAGKRAYDIPIGFFELMDNTGLPVGLYSMQSFSDDSHPDDSLFAVYGNFFAPRANYAAIVDRLKNSAAGESVIWFTDEKRAEAPEEESTVQLLVERFHAIGFLTSTEVVDRGLITIEDLEFLTQNAFLWRKGPFTIMNELGPAYVKHAVQTRATLAASQGQDFPICDGLRTFMAQSDSWTFSLPRIQKDTECDGAVRWITLSHPKAANAMDNEVFAEWRAAFTEANEDPACKVIVFDTAPIKTFIAGADITAFIRNIRSANIPTIVSDTRDWQDVIFHLMTGTAKPKIAIIDGKALGGGVEVASAFAHDPNTLVVMTTRTSFTLPETRLGIYPGLRGTIVFPQVIYRATQDAELALTYSRYMMMSGSTSSSAQLLTTLGFADEIVPPQSRNTAVRALCDWIISHGSLPTAEERATLSFERANPDITFREQQELQVIRDLFIVDDIIPTVYAYARGDREPQFSGWRKGFAQQISRRVSTASPFAVSRADWLLDSGFDKHLRGMDNESIAAYELAHHLGEIFEHPDAVSGLESTMRGAFPSFQHRYPFTRI